MMPPVFRGSKKVTPEDDEKGKKKDKKDATSNNLDDTASVSALSGEQKDQSTDTGDNFGERGISASVGSISIPSSHLSITSTMDMRDGVQPGQIYHDQDRPVWSSKFDFTICMVAFALDISNVWKFPWLCFKHRGLVFLIPYLVVLVLGGFPVFYLELIVGQFVRKGCIGIWKLCPIFRGVGYATVFTTFMALYSFNVVMTWNLHFAYNSWQEPLPWASCNNSWNSMRCVAANRYIEQVQRKGRLSGYEYFHGKVLSHFDPDTNTTYNITNLGFPDITEIVFISLLFLVIAIIVGRGIQNVVKIMWYSVGVSLVIIIIMIFRSITLPGSSNGLKYLFDDPSSFAGLIGYQIWLDAASQVFVSTGLGFGVHTTLASLNPFTHNIFRDTVIVIITNLGTSILALIAVFSFLGSHAFLLREELSQKMFEDFDLVFEIIPDSLARLPANNFFSFCFYFMLLALAISGILVAMNCIIISIKDEVKLFTDSHGCATCSIVAGVVGLSFALCVLGMTNGGFHIWTILDTRVIVPALFLCSFFQVIGISWFYGVDNVCRAVRIMNGRTPNMYLRICWKFVTPLLILLVLIHEIVQACHMVQEPLAEFVAYVLGTSLAFLPVLIFLVVCVLVLFTVKGPSKCLCLISPDYEREDIRDRRGGYRSFGKHWTFMGTPKQMETVTMDDYEREKSLSQQLIARNKSGTESGPRPHGSIKEGAPTPMSQQVSSSTKPKKDDVSLSRKPSDIKSPPSKEKDPPLAGG